MDITPTPPQGSDSTEPESSFIALSFAGLGQAPGATPMSVLVFVPESLHDDFVENREYSRVPFFPIPVPPPLAALYSRRLAEAAGGEDPDGDLFDGYSRISGTKVQSLLLLPEGDGISGTLRVVNAEGRSTELRPDSAHALIEAVLAGIPILIRRDLYDDVVKHVKVEVHLPGGSTAIVHNGDVLFEGGEDLYPEDVESLEGYLRRKISEQSLPEQEDPSLRRQLTDFSEEELMQLLDYSLEKQAYEWTGYLKLILDLKRGDAK